MVDNTKQEIVTEGFVQLIQEKTRSWRGQQDSCIDHIWTNAPNLAISVSNEERCPSDHHVISVTIRLKGQEGNSQEYFSRRRSLFNLNRFRDNLKTSQWAEYYSITNPDRANNWLEERIRNLLQEESPVRVVQPSNKIKSWITGDTMETFKKRDLARQTAKNCDLDTDWTQYRKLRNLATQNMRKDKKLHFKQLYENLEAKNDSQKLFKIIKNQLGLKGSGPPQSLVINGRKITAPKDLAEAQMKFFNEKVEQLISEIPRPTIDPLEMLKKSLERWGSTAGNRNKFSLKEVTVNETFEAIQKLGNLSAFGHNFIDSMSIKAAGDILAEPITYLINLSISKSTYLKS